MRIEWLDTKFFNRARITKGWLKKRTAEVEREGRDYYWTFEKTGCVLPGGMDRALNRAAIRARWRADKARLRVAQEAAWEPVSVPKLPTARLLEGWRAES